MDLCERCGMCCTGELFSSIEVTLEEAPRVASHRLPLLDDGARRLLSQPCPAHDGLCTIYADRPAACASFRCATLAAAGAGEISPDDALATLLRAKALAASVRARIPGRGALWRDVEAEVQSSLEWRRANAELLLDIAVAREALRHIRFG